MAPSVHERTMIGSRSIQTRTIFGTAGGGDDGKTARSDGNARARAGQS